MIEDLFDLLSELPWWVSVCFTGIVFLVLARYLPEFAWWSLVFLVPGIFSATAALRKRFRLDRQRDLDSIRSLSWKAFEDLLGEAYRRQGYHVRENTSKGADGGIDLSISRNGHRYLVQCKQWKTSRVGVKVVREMLGLVTAHKASGGIVVTSGEFTAEAEAFAVGQPIELLNGRDVLRLVKVAQGEHVAVDEIPVTVSHVCPRCGSPLVRRTARRGNNAGRQFWGCSGFPKCRYTEDAGE